MAAQALVREDRADVAVELDRAVESRAEQSECDKGRSHGFAYLILSYCMGLSGCCMGLSGWILDRFQFVAKMNKALDEVRGAETRRMAQDGHAPLLKKSRRCVLKHPASYVGEPLPDSGDPSSSSSPLRPR